jgi:hypothetical protein
LDYFPRCFGARITYTWVQKSGVERAAIFRQVRVMLWFIVTWLQNLALDLWSF